ncbi:hypothetical protein [Saccharothrix deserti]|uniref:hypothetical protein n=1 Tax=Saccharothrix deserti TaxID=2593674 RepID=UPI00131EBC67|nr:hypothetical protein [Saccharothrix deserti]
MTPIVTRTRVIVAALMVLTFSDITPGLTRLAGSCLAVLAVGYVVAVLAFPYRRCRACNGMGRHTSGLFGGIRLCTRCDGEGLRLRAGRRVLNRLRRNHRATRR